jgi:hypothetical protein
VAPNGPRVAFDDPSLRSFHKGACRIAGSRFNGTSRCPRDGAHPLSGNDVETTMNECRDMDQELVN